MSPSVIMGLLSAAGIGGSIFGKGSKDKFGRIDTLTQGQHQGLDDILSQIRGGRASQNYDLSQDYLSKLLSGDEGVYDQFAAPYMQNFKENILPGIAEQFGGAGGGLGGANESSAFGQALGGAGGNLQAQLANLFANLRQQSAGQAMGQYNSLAGLGLGTQAFQPYYQQGQPGFGSHLASGIGGGFGKAFGQVGGKAFSDWLG
jgi:hypothetical protein